MGVQTAQSSRKTGRKGNEWGIITDIKYNVLSVQVKWDGGNCKEVDPQLSNCEISHFKKSVDGKKDVRSSLDSTPTLVTVDDQKWIPQPPLTQTVSRQYAKPDWAEGLQLRSKSESQSESLSQSENLLAWLRNQSENLTSKSENKSESLSLSENGPRSQSESLSKSENAPTQQLSESENAPTHLHVRSKKGNDLTPLSQKRKRKSE